MSDSQHNSLNEEDARKLIRTGLDRGSKNASYGIGKETGRRFSAIALSNSNNLRAGSGRNGASIAAREVINLHIILDISGTMISNVPMAVAGINDMRTKLSSDKNANADSFEVTIWIASGTDAQLLTVTLRDENTGRPILDADGNRQEIDIANIPVKDMPRVSAEDFRAGGLTPIHKAMLTAMGAGYLRSESLAGGAGSGRRHRRISQNILCVISDFLNNHKSEMITYEDPQTQARKTERVTFEASDVRDVANDLASTERWLTMIAYAPHYDQSQNARELAHSLGIMKYLTLGGNVDNSDRDNSNMNLGSGEINWRHVFGIVSNASIALSQAQGQSPNDALQNNDFLS